jgi:hypothetical protein
MLDLERINLISQFGCSFFINSKGEIEKINDRDVEVLREGLEMRQHQDSVII